VRYAGAYDQQGSYGVFVQEVAGERYLYTQLEPLAARRLVPSIDEPDRKTPWRVAVEVPVDLAALGNAPVEREDIGADGKKVVTFAETAPLPTYLLALAVGPFELVDAGQTRGGAPIRIAAFRGQAARVAWAAQITPRIVEILEDWFGTPYPYAKLDQVPIPATVSFLAMENAGLVTYGQSVLLMDPKTASDDEKRRYVVTAGHELAHQWFGNLVTMAWWDDLWLNEAFATWMEAKVLAELSPAWASRVALTSSRSAALAADSLLTARRVRQPIGAADDIHTAFDEITYQKGETVIRMFEHAVGAEAFRDGVRAYLAAHAGGNATSDDFLAAIDRAAGRDVASGFRTFLDQPGAPRVAFALTCRGKKEAPVLSLRQARWTPRGVAAPDAARWALPVCVAYGGRKDRKQQCVVLDGPALEVALDTTGCPSWLLPNAGGLGYFRAELSAEALDDLLDTGWSLMPPDERVVLADDVRAMVDRGELPIDATLRLVPRLLRDGSKEATELAVAIARDALAVTSDATRPAVAAWIRDVYARSARKLGWMPDEGDDYARESKRAALVPLVAEIGREPKLLDRAVELARTWRKLPDGVRAAVLRGAVVASKASYEAVRDAALAATEADEREDLYDALAAVDDPALASEVLGLLLDPRIELRSAHHVLVELGTRASTQAVTEAFVRERVADLVAKLPAEAAAELVWVVTGSCDATRRADAAAWAAAHVEPLQGGVRTAQQALETMDQCIARRAAMGPALEAWLAARAD
jgi:alanyl aminopeptidase